MFAHSSENLVKDRNVWKDGVRGLSVCLCLGRGGTYVNMSLCVCIPQLGQQDSLSKEQTNLEAEETNMLQRGAGAKTHWVSQIIQSVVGGAGCHFRVFGILLCPC